MSPKACCELDQMVTPEFFRALGDPNRVAILSRLTNCCGEPRTVSQVAAELPVDLSVVSRHLRTLQSAGVLEARRQGKEVHYRVRYDELVGLLRTLADAIEGCCPTAPSTEPEGG